MADERLELLVIQPTPFCNLDCDYCYLPNRSSTARIGREVLQRTFEQVLASRYVQGPFTIVWHAGEPLALPIEFYRDAFRLLDDVNARRVPVRHSFQTNGTLLDDAWCDFIAGRDLRVGVSVDGPAFLHDAHRKTRSGNGTHARVVHGMEQLRERGIDFHVITVLTDESLDHPDELFGFYVEHGVRLVGFNIEEIEGIHASSSLSSESTAERVRVFFERFQELVLTGPTELVVRELAGMERLIVESTGFVERNQENSPMRILSVDCHGNVSTFSPELLGLKSDRYGDFLLGNVMADSLDSLTSTGKFRKLADDIEAGIASCRDTCAYFPVCGGGAPSNKYFENGSFASSETMHCRLSKKVITDVVLHRLELGVSNGVEAS